MAKNNARKIVEDQDQDPRRRSAEGGEPETRTPEPAAAVAVADAPTAAPTPAAPATDVLARIGSTLESRRRDRGDIEGDLWSIAGSIAKGATLNPDTEAELVGLLERINWTPAMFSVLVEQHKTRAAHRAAIAAAKPAEEDAKNAAAALGNLIAERDRVLAEFTAKLAAARATLADAESRARIGTDARRQLVETASKRTRELLAKAKSAAASAKAHVESLERRAKTELDALNAAADAHRGAVPGSSTFDAIVAKHSAQNTAYEAVIKDLTDARARAAEVAAEAGEIARICEVE